MNEDIQKAVREGLLFEYAEHFGKIWAAGNISKKVIHIYNAIKCTKKKEKTCQKSDNVQIKIQ